MRGSAKRPARGQRLPIVCSVPTSVSDALMATSGPITISWPARNSAWPDRPVDDRQQPNCAYAARVHWQAFRRPTQCEMLLNQL